MIFLEEKPAKMGDKFFQLCPHYIPKKLLNREKDRNP